MLTYMPPFNRLPLLTNGFPPPVALVGDEETPAQRAERLRLEHEIRLARRFTLNFALGVIALLVVGVGLWYVARAIDSGLDAVARGLASK